MSESGRMEDMTDEELNAIGEKYYKMASERMRLKQPARPGGKHSAQLYCYLTEAEEGVNRAAMKELTRRTLRELEKEGK